MKIEIGELTREMERDVKEVIEQCVNRYQHKRKSYYLFIYSERGLDVEPMDGRVVAKDKVMAIDNKIVIRTKILVLDDEPPRMLGTMCYKINNQKGQIWRLWTLPQDLPDTESVLDEDGIVQEVLDSSQIIGKFIH